MGAVALGRVVLALVALVALVLLQEVELAATGRAGEFDHATRRPWAGGIKAWLRFPNLKLRRAIDCKGVRKTLLDSAPMGAARHHSSVGRAAAL